MPVLFDILGDDLLIKYPDEPQSAKARAAELARRAAQRADTGDYAGAASLWRKALKRQPSLHSARRGLAHAYVELGDAEKAKPALLQVLHWDPEDLWALRALGNIWFRQADYQRAERFTRLALALEPANARTLHNLAAVCCEAGRRDEGTEIFRELIRNDPGLPNPYVSLAWELAQQHRCPEALAVVEDLFAKAKPPGQESGELFESARRIYFSCHQELLEQNRAAMNQTIQELHAETERLTGCPIRVAFEGGEGLAGVGVTELAWDNGRDHHLVRCLRDYPEPLRPHIVGKALLHIRTQWEARNAGKRRAFSIAPQRELNMIKLFEERSGRLVAEGMAPMRVARSIAENTEWLLTALLGSAANMQVETRLNRTIPVLRSAQLLSLSVMVTANLDDRQDPKLLHLMPPSLARAINGLHGLTSLFLDHLFDGVTDFAAHYRGLDGFDLSRRLWQHYQDRLPTLEPGDEFGVADEFAEIVGLAGRYKWRMDPFGAGKGPAA